ncbi:hypothetical protein [Methylocapsa palsarum]|nr:hypothetical protein [Methylocapsa palsarum]
MSRRAAPRIACLFVAACLWPRQTIAGAWLTPPGEGQIIASTAFSSSTRAFNKSGRLIPVPSYQKFELGSYIEYGVTDWLSVAASPSYDRIRAAPPAVNYDGIGESEAAAKIGLYHSDAGAVSVQAAIRSPGASINDSARIFQPSRAASIELRALAGQNIAVGAMPGFAEAQAAYRFYGDHQPGEWRLDLTAGLRPSPEVMVLLQSFFSYSGGNEQSGTAIGPGGAPPKKILAQFILGETAAERRLRPDAAMVAPDRRLFYRRRD